MSGKSKQRIKEWWKEGTDGMKEYEEKRIGEGKKRKKKKESRFVVKKSEWKTCVRHSWWEDGKERVEGKEELKGRKSWKEGRKGWWVSKRGKFEGKCWKREK